ncbi:MAG: hypothetical protein U0Z26_13540 [Anaerolineales bacterium]
MQWPIYITRGNYDGAIKVYGRALKWLNEYPDVCRGVNIGQLKKDAYIVINTVEALGAENISKFNSTLFKPIQWNEKRTWICDKVWK